MENGSLNDVAGKTASNEHFAANLSAVIFLAIAVIITAATFSRNAVWKNEISLWNDITKKSQSKPRGFTNLGMVLARHGYIKESLTVLERAAAIHPDYPELYNNLGNAYSMNGRYPEAVNAYKKALEKTPNRPDTRFNLAHAYIKTGQKDSAIKELLEVVRLNPSDYEAAYMLRTLKDN
ncbi:MAG: tetratricopeptide repeat protein [Deltaproteobacteria bacterium]|nr:tetratricopeptide repeat protein [Deltaproteobacteria bacterium]